MKKLFQNKCLALLLVFVMILGMLPVNVMAASQTVKVAGIELADGQCLTNNAATSATTWKEGDPYVAYYKDGVLYLNNLETEQVNSCIYFRGNSDLIIDVTGNNTLVRTAGTCINVESFDYGLVVQGTGTLTATGSSFGFWVRENVTFQGNVTVVAEGTSDVGIASNRGNTGLSDTKITIKDNARVTAIGGKYGIGGDWDRTPKVVVEDNAVVTAKGGTHAIRTLTAETVSNQKVFAGTDISGNSKETYIAANNSTYKYVEVNPTTYVATVIDGTGSGDYSAGTAVTITANAAPSGKQFKEWTGTAGLTFTSGSKASATATFTMPANAVTVSATYENRPYEEYDLWIGGVRATSDNASNITGTDIGGMVSYDSTTKTLTLNNATITGAHEFSIFDDVSGIYGKETLKINLIGNNTITGSDNGGSSYGIYIGDNGNLTFTGTGSLTVSAADLSENNWSVAVFADGSITVEESCTITAYCGTNAWVASAFKSYAGSNAYNLPNATGILVAGNKNAPEATNFEVCNGDPDRFQYLRIAPGYTVTLNKDGGTINSGNVTCYFVDTGATLPTEVTKANSIFGGWYDNAECTGTAITEIPVGSTGEKEYWAKWTAAHTCSIEPVEKVWPDCENGGKEAYYKCEGCGKCFEDANGTTEIADIATWGNLPKNGHTEGTAWEKDGTHHWHICTVAGCGAVIDSSKGEHTSTGTNVATCQSKAVCDACGATYGDFAGHDWNTASWEKDATGHWHKCNTAGCTEKSDFAQHTPDRAAATETDPVKCSACGYEITAALGHTHAIEPVEKVWPDCENGGKEAYYKCEGCGKFFEDANGTTEIANIETWGNLPKNGHDWNTASWEKDATGHWHKCNTAGCTEKSDFAQHTPDRAAATETDPVKCSACGYEITAALGHTHAHGTEWKSDEHNHWNECACGDKANTAAHKDENTDGKCDVCAYNVGLPSTPDDGNKPSDNPQTGDNTQLGLWIALLIASSFGIVAMTLFGKKKYSAR